MTFLSPAFFGLFAGILAFHWLLPARFRNLFLLIVSYELYLAWSWPWFFLLPFLTLASYSCGLAIHASATSAARRAWVLLAALVHLGLLAFFKIKLGVFSGGFWRNIAEHSFWIPLGLSYYTFQSLGYVIDVSRGEPPARNLVDYGLFLSFFPQIPAGPIGRARSLLRQIQASRPFRREQFRDGIHLIARGVFKKFLVADNLAPLTTLAFGGAPPRSGFAALLGVYAFALQIFADFSGYTDMARGCAKCLSLDLAHNFNLPFFATDMQEFWKRWHMSLSNWVLDFVYRPLLELPLPFRYFKLYSLPVITMTLVGLWHGISWNMILMGMYLGLLISGALLIKSHSPKRPAPAPFWSPLAPWLKRILTFHLFCLSGLLFRTDTLRQAFALLGRIIFHFSVTPDALAMLRRLALFAAPLLLVELILFAAQESGKNQGILDP